MTNVRAKFAALGAALCSIIVIGAIPSVAKDGKPHWGYHGSDGPAAWGELNADGKPAYPTCAIGKAQSPIDISSEQAPGNLTVTTDYKTGTLSLNPNDHTVEVAAPAGSTMTVGGETYKLLQVHFHTPSEHKIAGKSYPLEAHFVHRNDKGELAVLGILFEIGKSNRQLEQILREAKGDDYDGKIGHMTFDPNGLLPADLKVFNYSGSLTTPPCSEGVNWNVVVARNTVSADEPIVLETFMHGKNARPVQALNGR